MANQCRDCGRKDVVWKDTPDGRRLYNRFGVSIDPPAQHWLTCSAPSAVRLRTRRGLEPGVFPISVSRILAYRRCPRWYKLVYLDGYKDSVPPATAIGRDLHRYAAAKMLGIEPLPGPVETPPEFRHEWPELTRLVDWRLSRIDPEKVVGVEERIPVTWRDGAMTVALEVMIDLMERDDDLITVNDHKAGWQVPTEDAMRADLQTWTYAWAARTKYPSVRRFRVSQTHYRFRGREVWCQFNADELDAFGEGLKAEVGRIARDTDFRPNPACEMCPPAAHATQIQPYRSVILATANGLTRAELPAITSQAEYVETAARLRVAEAIVYAVRNRMQDYARENGPAILPGGGGYGHWYQAKRVWHHVDELVKRLTDAGVDLDRVVRFDYDALKPYISGRKKVPGLAEAMDRFLEEVPDSAYGWRKDAVAAALKSEEKRADAEAKIMAPMTTLRVVEGGTL